MKSRNGDSVALSSGADFVPPTSMTTFVPPGSMSRFESEELADRRAAHIIIMSYRFQFMLHDFKLAIMI